MVLVAEGKTPVQYGGHAPVMSAGHVPMEYRPTGENTPEMAAAFDGAGGSAGTQALEKGELASMFASRGGVATQTELATLQVSGGKVDADRIGISTFGIETATELRRKEKDRARSLSTMVMESIRRAEAALQAAIDNAREAVRNQEARTDAAKERLAQARAIMDAKTSGEYPDDLPGLLDRFGLTMDDFEELDEAGLADALGIDGLATDVVVEENRLEKLRIALRKLIERQEALDHLHWLEMQAGETGLPVDLSQSPIMREFIDAIIAADPGFVPPDLSSMSLQDIERLQEQYALQYVEVVTNANSSALETDVLVEAEAVLRSALDSKPEFGLDDYRTQLAEFAEQISSEAQSKLLCDPKTNDEIFAAALSSKCDARDLRVLMSTKGDRIPDDRLSLINDRIKELDQMRNEFAAAPGR